MRQKEQAKRNAGFSLVELIVTVLILGILAVVATTQIAAWFEKTKVAEDTAYAGEVAVVAESVGVEYLIKARSLTDVDYRLDESGIAPIGTDGNGAVTIAGKPVEALADLLRTAVGEFQSPQQQKGDYFLIQIRKSTSQDIVSAKVTIETDP